MLFKEILNNLTKLNLKLDEKEIFLSEYEKQINSLDNDYYLSLIQLEELKTIYEVVNLYKQLSELLKTDDDQKINSGIQDLYYLLDNASISSDIYFYYICEILNSLNFKVDDPIWHDPRTGKKYEQSAINLIGNNYEQSLKDFVINNNVLMSYVGTSPIVYIPNGVTEISDKAFNSYKKATLIVMPETVRRLNSRVFCNLKKLRMVYLSEKINEIPDSCFDGCEELKIVNLENIEKIQANAFFGTQVLFNEKACRNLKEIGNYAFAGNKTLKEVSLVNYYDNLGKGIFSNCPCIQSVKFGSNPQFVNIIFGTNDASKINLDLQQITIYADKIYENEFLNFSLKANITIIGEHIEICKNAFKGAKYIESITFIGKVLSIGESAFEGCISLSKLDMDFLGKDISSHAFDSCKSLIDYSFLKSINTIGNSSFANCNLSRFEFTQLLENVVSIDSKAFINSIGPEEKISISLKVAKSIGIEAFKGLTMIDCVLFTSFNALPDKAFYKIFDSNLKTFQKDYSFKIVIIKNNLIPFGFANYSNIERVKVGNTDNDICEHAFFNCTGLKQVDFFNPISSIGSFCFAECHNLVTITANYLSVKIANNAFSNCENFDATSLIASSISFADFCFSGCLKLNNLTFNPLVVDASIGKLMFKDCRNIEQITMSNSLNISIMFAGLVNDFSLLQANLKTLVINSNHLQDYLCKGYEQIEKVIINGNSIEIGNYVFEDCRRLKEVVINGDVISLGEGVYKNCYALNKLSMNYRGKNIPSHLFENCVGLHQFISFENITTIGEAAFAGMDLTNFKFDEDLRLITKIGAYAFSTKRYPVDLVINLLRIESIDSCAFNGAKYIKQLTISNYNAIPESGLFNAFTTTLEDFNANYNLQKLNIESILPSGAFKDYLNIDQIEFKVSGITYQNIFENCENLREVTLLGNCSLLNDHLFKNCINLKTINVSNVGFDIGEATFENCQNIKSFNVLEDEKIIKSYTLEEIIPLSKSIGKWAFKDTLITIAVFNRDLRKLGEGCLSGCASLKEIIIKYDNKILPFTHLFGDNYFDSSYNSVSDGKYFIPCSLTKLTFYGGIVKDNEFNNLIYLKTIEFAGDVKFTAESFKGCINVTMVMIDDEVDTFDSSLFRLLNDNVELSISANNKTYKMYENSMCSIDYSHLIYAFPSQKIIFHPNVKYIESGSIRRWTKLESLNIPKDTIVDQGAILNLNNLKEIILNENIEVCSKAISYTNTPLVLKKISINHPKSFPKKLKDLFNVYDDNKSSIEEVEIIDMELSKDFFEGLSGIHKVTIRGNSLLHKECLNYLNLETLSIEKEVTLEKECFGNVNVNNLTVPSIKENETLSYYFSPNTFSFNELSEVTILKGTVEAYTFENFEHLSLCILGDEVLTIKANAFSKCLISKLYISSSVNLIEDEAFAYSNIKDIELGEKSKFIINDNKLLISNGNLLKVVDQHTEKIVIDKTIKCLSSHSIENLIYLKEMEVLNDKVEIKEDAIFKCPNFEKINIGELEVLPGVLFKDSYKTIKYVTFHGKNIPEGYFKDFNSLVEITTSEALKKIGSCAFENCYDLEKISNIENVTDIGDYAFRNCLSLKELAFGKSIKKLGLEILSNAKHMEELSFETNKKLNLKTFGELFGFNNSADFVTILQNNLQYSIPNTLKKIRIKECLAKDYAFENLHQNLIIDKIFGEIGKWAFHNCTSLIVNDTLEVTSILNGAFAGSSIESVNLPACEKVEDKAFEQTFKLHDLTFDAPLSSFSTLGLDSSTISQIDILNNEVYQTVDNIIINKNEKALIYSLRLSSIEKITIPENVDEIKFAAFSKCKYLKYVDASFVKIVGDAAFSSCESLKEVTFSKNLNFVGLNIFKDTHLIKLTIPFVGSSFEKQAGFSYLFNCENQFNSLQDVKILMNIQTDKLFAGLLSLESVQLPSNLIKITPYEFSGCTSLKDIEIPDNITEIGEGAFEDCVSLTKLVLPWNDEIKLNKNLINHCTSLNYLVLPYLVNNQDEFVLHDLIDPKDSHLVKLEIKSGKIIEESFKDFTSLEEIDISGLDINIIPESCFENCLMLKQLEVPTTITKIRKYALAGCKSLTTNPFVKCNIERIASFAFSGCSSISELEFGDSLQQVLDQAFSKMSSLEKIYLPESIKELGINLFLEDFNLKSCSLPFIGPKKTEGYSLSSLFTENPEQVNLIKLEKLIILNDTIIIPSCFKGVNSLKEVTFDASVGSMGESAFEGLTNLEHIEFVERVSDIPSRCFKNCESLKDFKALNIKTIDQEAFFNCQKLTFIDGADLKRLGEAAFMNSGIEKLHIGGSLMEIPKDAFNGSSLFEINLPPSLEKIQENAFKNCQNLIEIIIPSGIKYIGRDVFINAKKDLIINLKDEQVIQNFDKNWNVSKRFLFCNSYYKNITYRLK